MKKIAIATFDAGGGHRAAVSAISAALSRLQSPVDIDTVNIGTMMRELDPLHALVGLTGVDIYNWCLKRNLGLPIRAFLPHNKRQARGMRNAMSELLRAHWSNSAPDLVISVMPWVNEALRDSLPESTPLLVLLTDVWDTAPGLWFPANDARPRCPIHFAVPTARAAEQAAQAHVAHDQVFQLSGLLVHPKFSAATQKREAVLSSLGLDQSKATALLSFGAGGSSTMLSIVRSLELWHDKLQVIALTGRNEASYAKLARYTGPLAVAPIGFTDHVEQFMRASDFMIGKCGGGTMGEALTSDLPMVAINELKLPWEEANCEHLQKHQLGIVVHKTGQIPDAVERLVALGELEIFRKMVSRHRNRTHEEIVGVVQRLLHTEPQGAAA